MTTFSFVVMLVPGIKSFHNRFVIILKLMTKVFVSKLQS